MSSTAAKNDYRVYADGDRHEMLEFVPNEAKRILDVGCSVGNFGELLKKERDAEVWGVEPDPEAAAIAETKLDKVICGLFDEKINLPKHHFDCIVFNDVLEHMVDPYSALDFTKLLLSECGYVVASIPNILSFPVIKELLFEEEFRYRSYGVLDKTHLRFFTRKSMLRMFDDCDYSVDRIIGISPTKSRKFELLNFLMLDRLRDWRFTQFVTVAKLTPCKSLDYAE